MLGLQLKLQLGLVKDFLFFVGAAGLFFLRGEEAAAKSPCFPELGGRESGSWARPCTQN